MTDMGTWEGKRAGVGEAGFAPCVWWTLVSRCV